MSKLNISLPLCDEVIEGLNAGDKVLLSGEIIVARDAAHKLLLELVQRGEGLPVDLRDAVVNYMGPSPAREGRVIGSAGPTTSTRMDQYTPTLLSLGLKGMIGKGGRSNEVINAMIKNHAVYFAAVGGCGALLSKCITACETVCYDYLGAEAVRRITVKDFPCIVAIDCRGNNLYNQSE